MKQGPVKTIDEATESGLRVIETIRERNGVVALDWHTQTCCNRYCYDGYRTVLERLLDGVLNASDGWITTPWNLTRHWHRSTKGLFEVVP